jgi:geranylgeranyl diphosphate synthase type I
MAVGKAFQIRDDILGVFGDEKKLGKPIGSDIIENKQTLLALKALKKGDKKQREVVKKLLGKKDLTLEELEDFRRVVRETGSLDYSNKLANQFIEEGFKVLGEMEILNKEGEDFLREVAKYVSIRNH